MDFAQPTDFVALDFISNNGSDFGLLNAYDSSGVLLASYTTAQLSLNQLETMSITRLAPDIAYITAGGVDGASSGGLDYLRYGTLGVPDAASTLALMGFSAVGLLAYRRHGRP